jgi:MFS family permease
VRALRAALAESALRRALVAFLAFIVMEEAVWLAVLLYAHEIGGPSAVGAVAVAQLVPATVLAPVLATWLDRVPVRRGLTLAYLSAGSAALALGVLLVVGAPVWAVVLGAVVQSAVVSLGRPAHYAALPRLAQIPSHLVAANAVTGSTESLGVMLGPLTVAVALTFSWVPPLVAVLGLLVCLGAALIGTARIPARAVVGDEPALAVEPFMRAATLGVREVRRIPGALTLLLILGLGWVLQGALDVLGVSFAVDVLDAGEQGASLVAAGNGLGLLIGSAAAAVLLISVARLSRVVVLGAVAGGLGLAAVGLSETLVVAVVLVVISGAARAFVDVAGRTLLHRNVAEHVMARVFGVQEAVLTGGLAIGAALAPLVIAVAGTQTAFAVTGAVLLVPALLALPTLRALDRTGVTAAEKIALLRRLTLFAPLALPDLERLALSSERCPVAAGETLIVQGALGDCFYAVESGRYRVDKDGAAVADLGPGDYFGEIALLSDVPRTASVVCTAPGDVIVMDRDLFLSAMTRARPRIDPV